MDLRPELIREACGKLLRSSSATTIAAFVVENKGPYSILSKGFHELSEAECAKAYPIVMESTLLILEERIAERNIAARRGSAKRALEALKKPDPPSSE